MMCECMCVHATSIHPWCGNATHALVHAMHRTSVDSYFQPQRNNNEAEEEEEEDGTRGGDHRVTWSDHHHHTAADPDSPSVFYDAEGHSAESPTHHHATTATTSSTSTAANAGSSRPQQRRSINIGTSYYNQPGYQQQRQHDVSTAIPDNEEVEFASVYTAPTVVLTTAEGEGGAHPHHDEQHPDEQGGGVLMMHAGGTSPAEHHHLRHGEDRRSGSSISEYQHNDYYTHLEKTNSCESPRLTVTVASTSTPPHGTDGGVERSSPPTEDGGGGTSSSSSTYHNPEHGAGGGKGVASKGGRAVDGSGGETAERPPQTIEQLLHGKAYGECLTRISLRSQIFRDWKPCLWVFESQDTLLVFRSRIDYMGFHCNPFIDAPTKAYMVSERASSTV